MEKDDILLGMEMRRLEIEPVKSNKNRNNDNPFINHPDTNYISKSIILNKETKCTCSSQKKSKSFGIYKKKHNKILKDPVLKILRSCNNITLDSDNSQDSISENRSDVELNDPLSLCTLVHNCNQLTISSSENLQNSFNNRGRTGERSKCRWWKSDVASVQQDKEPKQQSSRTGSCSQQALNPPCDVTIDELASYFETLVHIPKKMSSMAEMMYI